MEVLERRIARENSRTNRANLPFAMTAPRWASPVMGSWHATWPRSFDNTKQPAREERAHQFLAAGARLVPSRSALRRHGRSGMLRGEAWLRSRRGVGHSTVRAVRVLD